MYERANLSHLSSLICRHLAREDVPIEFCPDLPTPNDVYLWIVAPAGAFKKYSWRAYSDKHGDNFHATDTLTDPRSILADTGQHRWTGAVMVRRKLAPDNAKLLSVRRGMNASHRGGQQRVQCSNESPAPTSGVAL